MAIFFLWGVHERQGYKPGGERNKDYNEKIHKIGIDDMYIGNSDMWMWEKDKEEKQYR